MNIINESSDSLLERQYARAIEIRKDLNDNYNKWVNYYYLITSAILYVKFDSLKCTEATFGLKSSIYSLGISILMLFISLSWNFSTRGYFYWSNNWIRVIKFLECELDKTERKSVSIYKMFNKDLHDDKSLFQNKVFMLNVSTPKINVFITYLYILISILFISEASSNLLPHDNCWWKFIAIFFIVTVIVIIIAFAISKNIESHPRDMTSTKEFIFFNL